MVFPGSPAGRYNHCAQAWEGALTRSVHDPPASPETGLMCLRGIAEGFARLDIFGFPGKEAPPWSCTRAGLSHLWLSSMPS